VNPESPNSTPEGSEEDPKERSSSPEVEPQKVEKPSGRGKGPDTKAISVAFDQFLSQYAGEDKGKAFQVIGSFYQELFAGPLPHPQILSGYSEIIPDGANRIMIIAEKQQNHRIKIEDSAVHSQNKQGEYGQIFAFILGLVGLSWGGICALFGHDGVGGVISGISVVSLVSAFIYGRYAQAQDLREKRKAALDPSGEKKN